jgi:hypothetical protein
VYAGLDPLDAQAVLIRTFTDTMSLERQDALVTALTDLCTRPLVHTSIARALDCGVDVGVPYIVYAALPGSTVDEYLRTRGPRPLDDVMTRVEQLAAAVDYADQSGLHHGALGPRDIAFLPDASGISGFGLAQAVRAAGIDTNNPSLADDIYALGAMAFELLVGRRYDGGDIRTALAATGRVPKDRLDGVARALESALSADLRLWPASAGAFADALRDTGPARAAGAPRDGASKAYTDVGRLVLGDETIATASRGASARRAALEPPPELTAFDMPLLQFEPEAHVTGVDERAAVEPDFSETSVPLDQVPLSHPTRDTLTHPTRDTLSHPTRDTLVAVPAVGPGLLRSDLTVGAPGATSRVFVIAAGLTVVVLGALVAIAWFARAASDARVDTEAVAVADPALPPAPVSPPIDGFGGVTAVTPSEPLPDASAVSPPSLPPVPAPEPTRELREAAPSLPAASDAVPPTPSPGPSTPPPSPAFSGRLLVRSTPAGAAVSVDGQPRGSTPLVIRGLELGAHTIAVAVDGKPLWERRVILTVDRPALSFDLGAPDLETASAVDARGALHVDSRPSGAEVWLNGAKVGITPLDLREIGPGNHALRLELPGYRPWVTSVAVGRGERARVAASLER